MPKGARSCAFCQAWAIPLSIQLLARVSVHRKLTAAKSPRSTEDVMDLVQDPLLIEPKPVQGFDNLPNLGYFRPGERKNSGSSMCSKAPMQERSSRRAAEIVRPTWTISPTRTAK